MLSLSLSIALWQLCWIQLILGFWYMFPVLSINMSMII